MAFCHWSRRLKYQVLISGLNNGITVLITREAEIYEIHRLKACDGSQKLEATKPSFFGL